MPFYESQIGRVGLFIGTEPVTTILKCMMNAARISIKPKGRYLFLPHNRLYETILLESVSPPAVNEQIICFSIFYYCVTLFSQPNLTGNAYSIE